MCVARCDVWLARSVPHASHHTDLKPFNLLHCSASTHPTKSQHSVHQSMFPSSHSTFPGSARMPCSKWITSAVSHKSSAARFYS